MTKEEIYEIWRPESSPWSRWVKPVLFSFLSHEQLSVQPATRSNREWSAPPANNTAIVADLPGAEGVLAGLALSAAGYRPIPVYNACPFATYEPASDETPSITKVNPASAPSVVDVTSIMNALCENAKILEAANLPVSAKPMFLVDANRAGNLRPGDGWFDNRSFVSPGDFPSATFLREHGVSTVIVIRNKSDTSIDLLEVLLTWQRDGLIIAFQNVWQAWNPVPAHLKRPSPLRYLWHRLLLAFGYPHRADGTFGEVRRPVSS